MRKAASRLSQSLSRRGPPIWLAIDRQYLPYPIPIQLILLPIAEKHLCLILRDGPHITGCIFIDASYREQIALVSRLVGEQTHPWCRYVVVSYEHKYWYKTVEQYFDELQFCEVGEVQYCEEQTDRSTTFPLGTPGSREAQTHGSLKLVWVKTFATLAS